MAEVVEKDVEERVARLESDVAHIRSDVAEMKTDIRDLRADLTEFRMEVKETFSELRRELIKVSLSTKIWMLLTAGALLTVMARGFHWI